MTCRDPNCEECKPQRSTREQLRLTFGPDSGSRVTQIPPKLQRRLARQIRRDKIVARVKGFFAWWLGRE